MDESKKTFEAADTQSVGPLTNVSAAPVTEATYRVRVDRKEYAVERSCISIRGILAMADKTPQEDFFIWQIVEGKRVRQDLDTLVELDIDVVTYFQTLCKVQTDG